MFRRTEPPFRLLARKRRNSDSTPPITKFFATVKRERSSSESKNVCQKLDESFEAPNNLSQTSHTDSPDNGLLYSLEDLRALLGVPVKFSSKCVPSPDAPVGLENLPNRAYSHIFTILDMQSINALSLTSTKLCSRVKTYVSTHDFFRRMQLDNLDFLNSSLRPDDEEFLENDPFTACGGLIKSITITMNTKIRAQVFLNICRNLRDQLGGSLHGFGRLLETITHNWKFSERRIMVKAAIMIDADLRPSIIKVLTAKPGQLIGLEMKVRSGLTQLFLNLSQDIDEASPQEIIEFGSWLSVLIRNVIEKYQGKFYYILFGPTRSSRIGERVDWAYFCEDDSDTFTLRKSEPNYRKLLSTLLNGIRALRIMNNSKSSDQMWSGKKLYQLFLRIIEVCEVQGFWSETSSSMALAIDSSGLLSEYLVTCLDPRRDDYETLQNEAAEMVCLVRNHLYRWSAAPATFLAEPLHHAFNHLAQLDGHYDGCYKAFLEKIWNVQSSRLKEMVKNATNTTECSEKIREELDGQLSMARLLTDISNTVVLHQIGFQLPNDLAAELVNDPLEEEEQLE